MIKSGSNTRWTTLSGALLAACMFASHALTPALAQEPAAPETAPPTLTQTPAPQEELDKLEQRRDQNRQDLQELVDSIGLSEDKSRQLQDSIAALNQDTARIKAELIASAARRKDLEDKIRDGEDRLAKLGVREDAAKASLRERRGVLAEVLAALQRMGRNPPPALLVSPEDALASVRSAILLGAVVPGIRSETEKLVSALKEMTDLRLAIASEKQQLTDTMTASLEE